MVCFSNAKLTLIFSSWSLLSLSCLFRSLRTRPIKKIRSISPTIQFPTTSNRSTSGSTVSPTKLEGPCKMCFSTITWTELRPRNRNYSNLKVATKSIKNLQFIFQKSNETLKTKSSSKRILWKRRGNSCKKGYSSSQENIKRRWKRLPTSRKRKNSSVFAKNRRNQRTAGRTNWSI